jgi:division protein CdvB (Snf7/Vps24/ESCRT-III family)
VESHSKNVLDFSRIAMDTLASTREHIEFEDLLDRFLQKVCDERGIDKKRLVDHLSTVGFGTTVEMHAFPSV